MDADNKGASLITPEGIVDHTVGVANTNVTNLAVIAPGVAEALLSVTVGSLALLLAVIAHRVVRPRTV